MVAEKKILFSGKEVTLNDIEKIQSPVLRETLRKQFSRQQEDTIMDKCLCVCTGA